jgi:hypothetical protein
MRQHDYPVIGYTFAAVLITLTVFMAAYELLQH